MEYNGMERNEMKYNNVPLDLKNNKGMERSGMK
jgi:hypothetical protein